MKNTNFFSLSILFLLLASASSAQEKPVIISDSMNLQKNYPVVSIFYGSSGSGLRTQSECWESLGAGYEHINGKFVGPGSGGKDLDDGSYGPIALGFDYTLYGETYNSIYINVNGNITFGNSYSAYSPSGFPSTTVPAMIAPFWGDVDLRGTGSGVNNVYLKRESGKVIVQWVQVGFYKENTDPRNTFQVVLTDGTNPALGVGYNTRFAYGDMNWGVGNASGGTSGFGTTTYATVGAQSAGGQKFYQIGLFGKNSADYDGPGGAIDGVHYLDGRCFTMDLTTLNVPPIANDLPGDRTVNMSVGMTYSLNTSFAAPELDQISNVDITNSSLSSFTSESFPGNLSTQSFSFTASSEDVGSHYIYVHAYDDGTPAANAYDTILVNVHDDDAPIEGHSLAFDGSDDYVFVSHSPSLYSSGRGTFSFWIKPDIGNGTQVETVIEKEGQYEIDYLRETDKVRITVWKNNQEYYLESNGGLVKGEWSHVAFDYDGTNMKSYINGSLDNTVAFDGYPDNSIKPLLIGTNHLKLNYFNGVIDELAYIGTSLTSDEVRKMMFELENIEDKYRRYYYKCQDALILTDVSSHQSHGVLHGFDPSICWKRNYAAIWKGGFSSAWSAASNWEVGVVPSSITEGSSIKDDYVVIPKLQVGNNPLILDETAEVNNFVVQDGSGFELSTYGNLVLKQDLFGNSEASFDGELTVQGGEVQKLFGENTFNKLTIDNDVRLEGATNIVDDIILNSNTLFVNGNTLTLLSDTAGTAEIFHNAGSIAGEVTIQRTIRYKANSKGWHYLTSPVVGATFSQINESIPLIGFGNGPGGTPWPNVYLYDETVANQNKMVGWWSPDSLNQVIEHSQGFILYYNKTAPKTISFKGEVHTGQKERKVTNTNSNRVESDGWNLVGNPYPSMLNWDLVDFPTGMDQALYVYDNGSDRYSSYVNGIGVNGGSAEVASTQSFFVKSSSETMFKLNNGNRMTGRNKGWFRTAEAKNLMKIKVKSSTDVDEVVLVENSNATTDFNSAEDAYKLSGDHPVFELYMQWSGVKYSIKNFPITNTTVIPLYLTAVAGEYQLQLELGDLLSPDLSVFVEDRVTGEINSYPLGGALTFATTQVKDAQRFNLLFRESTVTSTVDQNCDKKMTWSIAGNNLQFSGVPTDSFVRIFDINGKLIHTATNQGLTGQVAFEWNHPSGVYLVKIAHGTVEQSLKVQL